MTIKHLISQVLQSCLLHIIHKGRYIASNCHRAFFRANHNASEMEAYSSALCQLRALLYLAQRLLHDNGHGQLYALQDGELSRRFVREYTSMHKACFYGRCLGFQVSHRHLLTLWKEWHLEFNIILIRYNLAIGHCECWTKLFVTWEYTEGGYTVASAITRLP